MNIILNHKLINLTQAKKTSRAKKRLTVQFPSEKIGVGYVISEGVCDFRNLSDFSYYLLPDFWICNKNITKNYKIISDYIISYLYLYNQ